MEDLVEDLVGDLDINLIKHKIIKKYNFFKKIYIYNKT
jgi:hypothetical protein